MAGEVDRNGKEFEKGQLFRRNEGDNLLEVDRLSWGMVTATNGEKHFARYCEIASAEEAVQYRLEQ